MTCKWSDTYRVVVHRFEGVHRICQCGEMTVAVPESRTAWGRQKPAEAIPEAEELVTRTPVLVANEDQDDKT